MDTAAEASAPLVYGLALKTPAGTVDRIVGALVRYHRRIGSRWQLHGFPLQAVLTCAFLEGGHTYRSLAEGNGVPKSTCYNLIQEGIKVLARRALPLTEVVRLAVKAGWDYLIVDGVNIPTERVNGRIGRKQPWYSGKHKRHGGSVTTIAAPDGELLWVSGVLPGRTVDIRVVPYSAPTGVLLSGYLAHRATISRARGPLFLSESRRNHAQPLSLWTWSKVVRRIALAADVPRFSTHTTRHLCLTDLARMGWELHAIATFAGHRHTDSTLTYIHLSGRDLADKLNRGMEQIHGWRVHMLARLGQQSTGTVMP